MRGKRDFPLIVEIDARDGMIDEASELLMRSVVASVLRHEGIPHPIEVAVSVCDDAEIRAINAETRNVDSPTDVLSFPALQLRRAGRISRREAREAMNYDSACVFLGDIVISIDRVRAQAAEYGHAQSRELAYLTAHAMLHLLGYDHMREDERAVMRAHEEKCLEPLGLTR